METANSQHAVLWPVVVIEKEGGGQQAVEVWRQRGAGHLKKSLFHHFRSAFPKPGINNRYQKDIDQM